jgi:hypothetical protein
MPKLTDLPKWDSLSAEEKEAVKKAYDIKFYMNYDGRQSYSPKEMKKSEAYQKTIEK